MDPSSLPLGPAMPLITQQIVQALEDADATRYLSGMSSPLPPSPHTAHEALYLRGSTAVGLIVLLYDHVLTFFDEVRLIWRAPASYPKYAFLFNRYLVLACLITIARGSCSVLYLLMGLL